MVAGANSGGHLNDAIVFDYWVDDDDWWNMSYSSSLRNRDVDYGVKAYMVSSDGLALRPDTAELLVFALIADRTEDPDTSLFAAPVETIAQKVGATPTQVTEAIVELVDKRLLLTRGTLMQSDGSICTALVANPDAIDCARERMAAAFN